LTRTLVDKAEGTLGSQGGGLDIGWTTNKEL